MKHKSLNTVILVLAFTGTLSSELQATQEPEAAEPEPVKGLTDEEALDLMLGDEAEAPPQRLGDEVYTIEDLDNLEAEEDLGNLEQLKLGAEQGTPKINTFSGFRTTWVILAFPRTARRP